jgi:hypothetical protein
VRNENKASEKAPGGKQDGNRYKVDVGDSRGNKAPGARGNGQDGNRHKVNIGQDAYMAGRRSMAQDMADASLGGVGPRLATEILYLLPDDFVKFYADLFYMALRGGGLGSPLGAMSKREGGLGKAKGNTGTVLGSASRLQAMSSGKRWRGSSDGSGGVSDGGVGVNGDIGLQVKRAVDKGLADIVRDAGLMLKEQREVREQRMPDELKMPDELRATREQKMMGSSHSVTRGNQCKGSKCGRFMKAGWKFCPSCGYERG